MTDFFQKEIWVLSLSASPFFELRGAIPLAFVFGFSPLKAYLLSVAGNMIPVIPLLLLWHYLSDYLMKKSYYFNRFFTWLTERVRVKHVRHFELWGGLALFLFVAIPIPLTGAWSGTVAAFVFGIPFWRSVFSIWGGVAVAGLLTLLAVQGIISLPF